LDSEIASSILRFQHIGTAVIVDGDSDFMPVAEKVKAAGRTLVGVGTRRRDPRGPEKGRSRVGEAGRAPIGEGRGGGM